MKTPLSRIHILIQNHASEIGRIWDEIGHLRHTVSYRIFEKTTQEDLDALIKAAEKERETFFEKCAEIEMHAAYIAYLKEMRNYGNNKYGVSALLREAANLEREKERLARIMAFIGSDQRFARLDTLHPVDFYKSSFTENNKIYDLMFSMFNSGSGAEIQKKMADLDRKIIDVNDRMAALNHSKMIELVDWDEFVKNAAIDSDFRSHPGH